MRTQKSELCKDIQQYLIQLEYWSPGHDCSPNCPLCNQQDTDYRSLTDAEVDEAWRDAVLAVKDVIGYDPAYKIGWEGLGCNANWRSNWEHNRRSVITIIDPQLLEGA